MPKRSLRERRERLGMTVIQLARLAEVPSRYASIGERAPRWAYLKMRRVIVERELRDRHWRMEARRIAEQRTVWELIDAPLARRRLIELLGAAAWKMLDAGQGEEADLVLEIMPEADATALLDEFFDDG